MKNKHLKLVSCALMATLFSTSSCVDNDYDLTEDIDLTIQVGGSEFAIPGGKTKPIELSKILDIDVNGVVKIDDLTGDYYLLQKGPENQEPTTITVDGFEIASPNISPIKQNLSFNISSYNSNNLSRANGTELPPVDLPYSETSFHLNSAGIPKEIKELTMVKMDMIAIIHFSFTPRMVDNLYLKTIDLKFPSFIKSPKLTNGVLHLENDKVNSLNGLTVEIPISGIDCKNQDGITFGEEKLSIEGEVSLEGKVTINTGEVHAATGGSFEVTLTADVTLLDSQSQQEMIHVKSVTGKVAPEIDIQIDPVTLTGLPDFLDDERVTLSVEKPLIFFTVNNEELPVSAKVKGTINSFTNKDNHKEPVGGPAEFDLTIKKETNHHFCLYPSSLSQQPEFEGITDYTPVNNLTSLISKIPDIFEFDITANADAENETEILLNHTYQITTDYEVNVPFVFGDKITQIVYKDSVDGWYEDMGDYEVTQVNATATAINSIPLGLSFTATALTVDRNGNAAELKGVTVNVKVDGKKDGIIKAGKNNVAANSELVIEIKETTPGAVKKLDGLAFEIVAATSGEEAKGQQLNKNQTLQLTNVRLKVPNGVIVDLN